MNQNHINVPQIPVSHALSMNVDADSDSRKQTEEWVESHLPQSLSVLDNALLKEGYDPERVRKILRATEQPLVESGSPRPPSQSIGELEDVDLRFNAKYYSLMDKVLAACPFFVEEGGCPSKESKSYLTGSRPTRPESPKFAVTQTVLEILQKILISQILKIRDLRDF